MITDAIISVFMFLPLQLLELLEPFEFSLSLDRELFEVCKDMFLCLDYIISIPTFILCLGVRLAVRFWRIPYSIVLRIKSFIPTMGD